MHHNVLGDVGMHYSLAVMFHVFPVVKRRENRAVMSKDRRQCTHRWCMWKRVGLTTCSGRGWKGENEEKG